jgi:hypothetical protein
MDLARILLSGMWLQDGGISSPGESKWLIVFVGLVAVAMVTQAITVVGMAIGAAKTRKRVMEMVEELRGKVLPLIDKSHELVHDAAPKVKIITENLAETSHLVRSKAQDLDATLTEANAKTRAQVARVDGMVTSVLNTTADIAETIQRGVKVPVREFSGLINGLKAGLDVLMGRGRTRAPQDRDQGW